MIVAATALIVLAALAALPFLREMLRKPMTEDERRDAPGRFARLSDGRTHYQWHGPNKGPVAVFVHGLTTPSWVFAGLVRGFTMMGFRVLSYDLYGRGWSDRPPAPQTRQFFLRQLRELLADQGVDEPIVLLGYSMGGAIATVYTADEPDNVDRLILIAPAGIDLDLGPLLDTCQRLGVLGNWLWLLLGPAYIRRASRMDSGTPSVITDIGARMRRELRLRGYLPAVLSARRHLLGEVLEKEHREIARMYVAVTSVWGENDTVIPISSVGKLAEWNRDAYKFVIPGTDHALAMTHPNEVIQAIQENMREV